MEINENTSDGYHTFAELYDHRAVLAAALFQMLMHSGVRTWRSTLHADGTMFDHFFVVGADLPTGPITYHCDMKHWDLFRDATVYLDNAPEYDGHTPADVLMSLKKWIWQ